MAQSQPADNRRLLTEAESIRQQTLTSGRYLYAALDSVSQQLALLARRTLLRVSPLQKK